MYCLALKTYRCTCFNVVIFFLPRWIKRGSKIGLMLFTQTDTGNAQLYFWWKTLLKTMWKLVQYDFGYSPVSITSGCGCISFGKEWVTNSRPSFSQNLHVGPIQAFLDFRGFDFRDFRFTAVYNSILFSSPLVLLSNLDLRGFCFGGFFLESRH